MSKGNEWTEYDDNRARAEKLFGKPIVLEPNQRIVMSKGTPKIETDYGHFATVEPIFTEVVQDAKGAERPSVTRALLDDAAAVINGGRRDVNGNPERSFTTIADFWNAYIEALRMKQGTDSPRLTGSDVAQMMELLKLARGIHGKRGERDHYLDRIGYAALAYEQEARKE